MVEWKDLSFHLKAGVVGGWLVLVIYSIYFIIGFIKGLMVYG